jgi:hypothetical protein
MDFFLTCQLSPGQILSSFAHPTILPVPLIDVQKAHDTKARTEARFIGPARGPARPILSGPVPARPG